MLEDKNIKHLIPVNFLLLFIIFSLTFGPWMGISSSVNAIVTMLAAFLFMLIHGYLAWSLRNIIAFLLITWICSFCFEALGVATGVIFGQYYYTDHLGPKILGVPLMIQVSYAAMGYASLSTGRLILGITGNRQMKSLLLSTLIGALLMVGWDLCLDPYESTVLGDWIWPQGGPYFGIGVHNFVGWFFTVFIFMFLYQLFAYFYPEQNHIKLSKTFLSQPVLYYAIMGLNLVLVPLVGGLPAVYATPANYAGSQYDLVYSLSLITFFVMGTPSFIAFAQLWLNHKDK